MSKAISGEPFEAFITKYALTNGIERVQAQHTGIGDMIVVATDGRSGAYTRHFLGQGREWHRSEAEAVARAEGMRAAKIKSLRGSIAKLEALRFTAGDA